MAEKISKVHLFVALTLISGVTSLVSTRAQATTAPVAVTLRAPAIVPDGQDGSLDTNFGSHDDDGHDGYLEITDTVAWRSTIFGSQTLVQSDGKILSFISFGDPNLSVGTVSSNSVDSADAIPVTNGVQRRLADGQLDRTFGTDGTAIVNFTQVNGSPIPPENEVFLTAMALQSDGKIVITGSTNGFALAPAAQNADSGEVNTSVSSIGIPFVMRMTSDGSMDNTFGVQGVTSVGPTEISDGFTTTVLIQRDGKVLVSGSFYDENDALSINFVARFQVNGTQDLSFATGGVYLSERSVQNSWTRRIFQQTDGKLVIIGDELASSDSNDLGYTYLERLSIDGQPDLTYGIDGLVSFPKVIPSGYLRTGAMQSDNKVLLFAYDQGDQSATISKLIRLGTDGTIDETFGTNGEVVFESDNGSTWALVGLNVQPDGKIVASGFYGLSNDQIDGDMVVVRLRADGSPDYTFGESGILFTDEIPNLYGLDVQVQPNGQLLISGVVLATSGSDIREFIVRLNATQPVSINGLTPSRLADTRRGSPQGTINVAQKKYGSSSILELNISGVSGLPLHGIGSVILNVTATEPESDGYLSVYACGTRPETSHLNFVTNQVISTSVTTEVSLAGKICIYASAPTNIIVDVNGWSAPNTGYVPIAPARLFDTRSLSPHGLIKVDKKKYGVSAELRVKVAGVGSLPSSQFGSLNTSITVTEPSADGYLTVYPCGTRPLASSLNFTAGQTISASVTTPVSSDGEICIYSSAPTNVIADAFGWSVAGTGITPVVPTRLIDTRSASPQGVISITQKKYGASDELRLPLHGAASLPTSGMGSVQLTLTVTGSQEAGFITVYPCGILPLASHLNFGAGQTIATAVTAQVSADGEICVHSSQFVNIIVDINGWGNQPRYGCDGSVLEVTESKRIGIMCR